MLREKIRLRHALKRAGIERVETDLAELPGAVRYYSHHHGLPLVLTLQSRPVLRVLNWNGFVPRENASPDEIGSLVFCSGLDTAVLDHFLPLHQLAVFRAWDVLPHLRSHAAARGLAPCNANLITSASGMADIGGTYVCAAHGSWPLHALLAED